MRRSCCLIAALTLTAMPVWPSVVYIPPDDTVETDEVVEETVVLGSRSLTPRTVSDAISPIDVFDYLDLSAIGNAADITDSLRSVIPYYNAPIASGDGDTFVRNTSLRGLAPDQTLLLVNGKRRHRAAVISEFVPAAGKGAHGPNIGMIPTIAVRSVEILRAGAGAQYGADAIAGVINLNLRESDSGGTARAQYGSFFEGERSVKFEGNVGMPLADTGFVNLSMEVASHEAHSRGIQRHEGNLLEAAGVAGVGTDSPFDDAPKVHTWGRPQSDSVLVFANAGFDASPSHRMYVHGNYAQVDARYRFFFRRPEHPDQASPDYFSAHSTIAQLRELGFTGLRAGFTPFFDGETEDVSLVVGLKGSILDDTNYDVSLGYGRNDLGFTLNNTLNPTIGLNDDLQPRQMDFDVGALRQTEYFVRADISRQLSAKTNIAAGTEWHKEVFTLRAGEPVSYEGLGASGFAGLHPRNAGSFGRHNVAIFGELEHQLNADLLLQSALRYEGYSDFGGTLNGKLAARFSASDNLKIRGGISTGFHAPTPGQSNIQKTTTTFDANQGDQVEQGLVPPDSPLAVAAGGKALTEETSINVSVGFTSAIELLNNQVAVAADLYRINIEDRIYKTQTIPSIDPRTGIGTNISFFTNALDIRSQGVDLVISSEVAGIGSRSGDLAIALSYNSVGVVGQSLVNGIQTVSDADIEDIENSYPNLRVVCTYRWTWSGKLKSMVRANFYGAHYDERGRIDDPVAPTAKVGATMYVDMETTWELNPRTSLSVGFINLLDEYVDVVGPPNANRQNVGLLYPRRTAANYEGGSWYLTTQYEW